MKKIIRFFEECIAELKKVTWPTKGEALSSVKVVFISTIVVAVALGVFDWIFTTGATTLLGSK
ncbi:MULTISPECIES: preprotein translocase subunit SecE [Treponema]|jgi:preprotein translocase subunit SecE|uniref:Protein translocase subunit SecE n=1 Tax=Treponema rectale TaxID=744512 RepID=A0A840SCX5_9SPIR|nr:MULTISPECIES: preprotein translocase subunit SecE [Treponema]MBB5218580.1 preprotein translocase subunit SecE [Treponema rectale]MBE6355165.1 preprotein translocase subunit SecE [Treponema sp.]MBO6176331.1 preprotein translocase subunit SecE [Treponema sp.]